MFVKAMEGYYGAYRPAVRKAVAGYTARLPEWFLDRLYQTVIRGYSGEYKYTPDVAILERFKRELMRDVQDIPPTRKLIEKRPLPEEQEEVAGLLRKLDEKLRYRR
jgi:hypothetical protein